MTESCGRASLWLPLPSQAVVDDARGRAADALSAAEQARQAEEAALEALKRSRRAKPLGPAVAAALLGSIMGSITMIDVLPCGELAGVLAFEFEGCITLS